MKHNIIFLILIGMTCFFYTSCEKSGYQMNDSRIMDEKRIIPRDITDCDECPVGYCCCAIELVGTGTANLIFCGVYDVETPTTPCGTSSPPSPCASISGSIKIVNLTSTNSRDLFCVPSGNSFSIYNDGEEVTIWFTCQPEVPSPDFVSVTIPADTTLFFDSFGGCYLTDCL